MYNELDRGFVIDVNVKELQERIERLEKQVEALTDNTAIDITAIDITRAAKAVCNAPTVLEVIEECIRQQLFSYK